MTILPRSIRMRVRVLGVSAIAPLFPIMLAAQAVSAPAIDFSGVIFGSFQYRTDSAAKALAGGKSPNRFDVERAYLTLRMPAGERTSVRVTTDVFQNTGAGYYAGWTVRLKYGYVHHELTRRLFGKEGLTAAARVGMLHTVVVDHMEAYWPRSLGTVGVERNGFFSSADVGAAGILTLPHRRGEAYLTLTNGSNYTSAETDRFKDLGARVTLTPFANRTSLIRSVAVSPWYYYGTAASAFALGGPGQVGPVSSGLTRDRRGVFLGLRDRGLTGGAEFAQRVEGIESGGNTVASPRVVRQRTSDLVSAFALVPLVGGGGTGGGEPARPKRLGAVIRWDQFKLDQSLSPGTRFVVLGLSWGVTPGATLTFDVQSATPTGGSTAAPARTLFVHWKADF